MKTFVFTTFVIIFFFTNIFGKPIIYHVPPGEKISAEHKLKINGKPAFFYQPKVSAAPINQVWPGYQRPLEQTELASFCYFDTNEVTIEITSSSKINSVVMLKVRLVLDSMRPGYIHEIKAEGVRSEDNYSLLHDFGYYRKGDCRNVKPEAQILFTFTTYHGYRPLRKSSCGMKFNFLKKQ